MRCALAYGESQDLQLEVAEQALVAYCPGPRGAPIEDPAAELTRALRAPLASPALARHTVPGDRIVVAVDRGVPQAASLVTAIVDELAAAGAEASRIEVLQAPAGGANELLEAASLGAGRVARHDPAHRETVGLLAATRDGSPIYLHRDLLEADLVVWLSAAVPSSAPRWHGVSHDLYPTFADAATQRRFVAAGLAPRRQEFDRRRREAAEASWLAGSAFYVSVVPGPRESILHVAAGESAAVKAESALRAEEAWAFCLPRPVDLAVVALPGGASQQTWAHVGRAATVAARIVAEDGAIVVCSEVAQPPGPALELLGQGDDPGEMLRALRASQSADSAAAYELARARRKAHLFLHSALEAELVESLGLAPATAADIARLAARRESVALVGGGQFASLSLARGHE
jgi:nickel-dependent lactate racemase